MNQPEYFLKNGTKVKTHAALESTEGMLIKQHHLDVRTANADGEIAGVVGGHGGDVYYVRHADGAWAAYCFTEFELA